MRNLPDQCQNRTPRSRLPPASDCPLAPSPHPPPSPPRLACNSDPDTDRAGFDVFFSEPNKVYAQSSENAANPRNSDHAAFDAFFSEVKANEDISHINKRARHNDDEPFFSKRRRLQASIKLVTPPGRPPE